MNESKNFSQRSFLRAPGLSRFFLGSYLRSFCRFLAAFVMLVFVLTAGAGSIRAAESNRMSTLSLNNDQLFRESQGFLVEELDGDVIEEQNEDTPYNPASAVKILTAYAAIKSYGPDFRFNTNVFVDGSTSGGFFEGDIYLQGSNPFFNIANLQEVFAALRAQGINTVNASLFVSPDFKFAGNAEGQKSANAVKGIFGGGKRKRARALRTAGISVKLKTAQVRTAPAQAKLAAELNSPTVLALIKDMLSRSDNEMAALFGNAVGGPQAVARTCRADFAVSSDALSIATASGLGVNRVSPRAMIAALRGFKQLLAGFKLNLSDALPIAGIDYGTIYKRFLDSKLKGVLVGKTGTLKQTDRGASVLVGEMSTLLRGQVLFVVFQRGRNTGQLRLSQNRFLEDLLIDSGGPGAKYGV